MKKFIVASCILLLLTSCAATTPIRDDARIDSNVSIYPAVAQVFDNHKIQYESLNFNEYESDWVEFDDVLLRCRGKLHVALKNGLIRTRLTNTECYISNQGDHGGSGGWIRHTIFSYFDSDEYAANYTDEITSLIYSLSTPNSNSQVKSSKKIYPAVTDEFK